VVGKKAIRESVSLARWSW